MKKVFPNRKTVAVILIVLNVVLWTYVFTSEAINGPCPLTLNFLGEWSCSETKGGIVDLLRNHLF
jgi:hypothetical protein